ncbi:CHAT domain-containing protein [Streptomyces sp. NPDC050625]|uniref:CHAT domain-containing protein n=1 Tax=Streptomyces sp. NPDC050625 TaxID=3154629 RepID=UPI003431735C
MTTDTTDPGRRPGDSDRPAERARLLAAVRERLEGTGTPAGNARLHTEEAHGETGRLLWHLMGPAPDGGFGLDPEVVYVLGVTYLFRAHDRPDAPTAERESRYGLTLLAPFYFHLPGQEDVLPPDLRAALDGMAGPDAGRPEEPAELVQRHAEALTNLAMLVMELAVALPYPEAFELAAGLTRDSLPYLSPEGPDRALAGCNLGYALLLSAVHGDSGPERLSEAVDVLRTAFSATPPGHPNHARCANGLGLALLASAERRQDRAPVPEAVEMLRTATRAATEGDQNRAQMYSDLGYALVVLARGAEDGEAVGPELREEAVTALRRSLDLTDDGQPEQLRERLGRLADAELIGIPDDDRPGAAAQASQAAGALRRLLGLTPDGHPERGELLLRLAANLVVAQRPREAVGLLTEAGALFAGDAERAEQVQVLLFQASMLQGELASRSDLTPEQREDWEAVDSAMRSALSGDPAGHPLGAVLQLIGMGTEQGGGSRGQELMELGALVLGYPEQVSLSDLFAKTMELQARRIARLPETEREQALADFLAGEGTGSEPDVEGPVDPGALDELLDVHERLLGLLPAGSREHGLLKGSRNLLRLQKITYESMNEPEEGPARLRSLRRSLPLLREMFDDMPEQLRQLGIAPELFGAHTALMFSSESPFDQLEAVEEGVRGARRRLTRLTPGTPEYDEARTSLAVSLFFRDALWPEEADFEEAVALARELTAVPDPGLRTAMLLTQWTSATRSHLEQSRSQDRPAARSFSRITRMASDRAARALDERDPVDALETLEDGRAHLLSTALNTRRELEVLHGADADLHARLRAALDEVRALRRRVEPGHWADPDEFEAVRAASGDAARLVAELQRRPGFRRFLTPLPLGLDDLLPAAAEGPVVSVNVHPRRCDALALCADGLRTVPLPELDAADLAAQAESFRLAVEALTSGPRDPLFEEARDIFTGTLAWLWDVLAEPVLDALGLTGRPPSSRLRPDRGNPHEPGAPWPRLWWSPSGVLNSFPLHAAGHHGPDAPAGAAVLDRVASSYTPTLRALLFSRARRRAAPGRRSTLAVAMPETAGQAPLARTVAEAAEAVAAGGGVPLIGAAATRDAVRAAVPAASLVHFACHADSDPEEPAAGRLLLADGDLFLQDIAELRLESAELAYLSACGTARGSAAPALADEAVHLASAFQLAGYAQSVATLWEVGDAFAADAAARFHRTLAPSLPHPGPLPAAQALHHTVRSLRAERPDLPWTWAALVHAGA